MTLRLGALHDALLKPGDAELARKASEEVAAYEHSLSDVKTDLRLLKWMVGTLIVLVAGLFWQGFAIMQRLP